MNGLLVRKEPAAGLASTVPMQIDITMVVAAKLRFFTVGNTGVR